MTFCEKDIGHWHAPRYRQLAPLWIKNNDGLHRIYYRVEGELGDDGTVCTWRTFLNLDGQPLPLHDIEKLARGVIRIHPVLRLRDARFIRRLRRTVSEDSKAPDKVALNRQLDQLSRELVRNPQN